MTVPGRLNAAGLLVLEYSLRYRHGVGFRPLLACLPALWPSVVCSPFITGTVV